MGDSLLRVRSIDSNFGKSKEKTMNSMKRLSLAISLTIVLAGTVFACPNPGELNAPPCTSTQLVTDDPADQSTTIADEVETITIETVISTLEDMLTVF